nr:SpoIVB peptidase [Texcoconibacillus texcoconensis]
MVRRFIGAILLVMLIGAAFYTPLKDYVHTPNEFQFFSDQTEAVATSLPVINQSNDDPVDINEGEETVLSGVEPGDTNVTFGIGNFPLKSVDVSVLPDLRIIPGGQSIGVKVHTLGVLVVGHHLVETEQGTQSPGEDADVKVGDIIKKINGETIEQMNELAPYVENAGKKEESLKLEIERDGETITTSLFPKKGKDNESYRLGLYIRDSAAGVGTLTFYDPTSKAYGALGHVIADMDTQKPVEVNNGEILRSKVTSIEKGETGEPGEKLARFTNQGQVLGNITKNSSFGIFGELHDEPGNGKYNEPMPIGLSDQVEEGPAKMLTVVEGEEVEAYDIEIVSSKPQKFPATKGMVVKVTDDRLLNATGGIVQGMSGSPIIQNDKVVGAVTHVFVNDPTSGYGAHIQWMLEEAGIDIEKGQKEEEKAS